MDWPFIPIARPSRCRLLELPAELREAIFEFTLTSTKPLVAFRLDDYQKESYQEATQPAITLANRQIRRETLPIFYQTNEITLHTDGSKFENTRTWLRCINAHISKLQRVSLWVRYITWIGTRSVASGAICLSLQRTKQNREWRVDSQWRWITVTRAPSGVKSDAKFLVRTLQAMLAEGGSSLDTAESFAAALADLGLVYAKEKML